MRKKKISFGILIASSLALWLIACGTPATPDILEMPVLQGKNVIMISLDTLRRDRMGAYGNPLAITPFMDRFSQNAVVFDDVASQSASTWTSHRSVFVSRYVSQHRSGDPAPGSTLADHFQINGYRTAAFVDGGKMHRRYGHAVGFQEYDDSGGHFEKIIPKAQQWILDNKDHPFFLFLHTYDIHAPYNPLKHDDQIFLADRDVPDFYRTEAPIYLNTLNLNDTELEKLSDLYNGGVRSCDRKISELFRFLEVEGILDESIVVLFSDHGESLGERDHLGHHEMYYSQLAVPLVFKLPGFPGRLVHGTVENVDIMPTLLDLAGFGALESGQGLSQKQSIIEGHVQIQNRFHIAENKRRTIFRGLQWKLIVGPDDRKDEIYLLAEDPAEETNRVLEHPEQVNRLLGKMAPALGVEPEEIRTFKSTDLNLEIFKKDDETLRQQLEMLGYLEKQRED